MEPEDVEINIHVDTSRFERAVHDATISSFKLAVSLLTKRAETAERFNLKLIAQAKEQAATIERAVELRDKWLKWPKDDPHYGAGLMLARELDLPMEEI